MDAVIDATKNQFGASNVIFKIKTMKKNVADGRERVNIEKISFRKEI